MGDSDNCCFCFPIDCGVKTYAALIILSTMLSGCVSMTNEDFMHTFWVEINFMVIMSIAFVYSILSPTESSKKCTFFVFIVCMVFVLPTYTLISIWNGSIFDFICSNEHIEAANELLPEDQEPITR